MCVRRASSGLPFLVISAAICIAAFPALGQTWPPAPFSETTVHGFAGGMDAFVPQQVTLATDGRGALYGTSSQGGANNLGAVFKLSPPTLGNPNWTESILHSFSGNDGENPYSGLVFDSRGALYGTTFLGGANGAGTVFKLSPPDSQSANWTLTTLFSGDSVVGSNFYSGVIIDSSGSLYGTAIAGGANNSGTVYKLSPPTAPATQWSATALHNFTGGVDGAFVNSPLVMDTSGALYGTTQLGGNGAGVVYKLTPRGGNCNPDAPDLWCEYVLYSFTGGRDGGQPNGGVILDGSGGLYGAASAGGANNWGVAFRLSPPTPPSTPWIETVLYNFTGGKDGASPLSPLTLAGGALYGTTVIGNGTGCGGNGCGAVFQLRPPAAPTMQWSEATLYDFTGGLDGGNSSGGVMFNALGFGFGAALYGVTSTGGVIGGGTVFALQCAHPGREVFGGAQHAACAQ
jgi:uncharacterized repeat protein (TIGR03803 family)